MLRPNKQFVRAVLIGLMLIVGSVQAHQSYFCSIMQTVIHGDCCCAGSDVDDVLLTENEPCCEKSVELGIDSASQHAQTTTKPIKFESDVDPPNAIASTVEYSLQSLDTAAVPGVNHTNITFTLGSAIYLNTQRLRI